jgi:hypothetical protein
MGAAKDFLALVCDNETNMSNLNPLRSNITMKTIAAYAYSTGARALKRLQTRSTPSALLRQLPLLSRKSLLLLALLLTLPAVADCPSDLTQCRNERAYLNNELMACANNLQNCGDERQTLTDTVISLQQMISYQQEQITQLQQSNQALSQANLNLTVKNASLNTYIDSLLTPTVDFGAIPLGFASQKQALYKPGLASNGQAFTGFSYALVGTHAADFSVSGPVSPTPSVAGNERTGYVVNFTPTAAGNRTATLQVTAIHALGNTVTSIPLSGNGVGTTTTGTSSIVIDPATSTTLYAGLDGGGVYASTDSSANWSAINGGLTNLNVRALAMPNSSTLFAATYDGGVFKGTYSAGSWSWAACGTGLPGSARLRSLVVDSAGNLYAGSETGVFKNTTACGAWTAQNTGMP